MRNPYRSRQSGRPDTEPHVVGVGEFRAVAERLLEAGAQYLEQGREWLHAATRGQGRERHAPEGGGTGFAGNPGPGSAGRQARHPGTPYAPDEYSFSETGGVFDPQGGRHDEGPGAHGFEAELDEPLHRRARPGRAAPPDPRRRHGRQWNDHGGDAFLPGSYGFGGEGRHEPGGLPDEHGESTAGWERAYRAQGRVSYRGRGPRGYVRSDERILEEVHERLCDDPIVDATDIEVHCDQGRVILAGKVPTRWMKHRAEDIADSVRGARDIDNRIRVSAEEPVAQGDFDTSRTTGASAAGDEAPGSGHAHGDGSVDAAARGARDAERAPGPASATGATQGPKQPH